MFAKRVCFAGLAVYAALNLTDYVQTYALIRTTEGGVYEANPVANVFLNRLGWSGLAVYKAATVALVVGSVALLSRRRPTLAVGVVTAGCLALTCVTFYSHSLVTAAEANGTILSAPLRYQAPRFGPRSAVGTSGRKIYLPRCDSTAFDTSTEQPKSAANEALTPVAE